MNKIRCIKIELEDGVGYLVDKADNDFWSTTITAGEVGEVYRVEVIEMEEDKLNEIPEFGGF